MLERADTQKVIDLLLPSVTRHSSKLTPDGHWYLIAFEPWFCPNGDKAHFGEGPSGSQAGLCEAEADATFLNEERSL
jgi:hypothetical protein